MDISVKSLPQSNSRHVQHTQKFLQAFVTTSSHPFPRNFQSIVLEMGLLVTYYGWLFNKCELSKSVSSCSKEILFREDNLANFVVNGKILIILLNIWKEKDKGAPLNSNRYFLTRIIHINFLRYPRSYIWNNLVLMLYYICPIV